jgi:hypothetical protein
MLAFPVVEHAPQLLALQVFLGAAEIAGNDGKAAQLRVGRDVCFARVRQRANDDVPAVVALEFRRHRRQPAAVEQVEEKRGDDVVAVMTQGDLVETVFLGVPVQGAAAQPRAQRAHRLAFGNHALDHRVGVLLDLLEAHAALGAPARQDLRRKARLLLVEIDRDQREVHRRRGLQLQQQLQHRVGILAAGQAHHHAVAGRDHRVILDRLAHRAAQALGELVDLDARLFRNGAHGAATAAPASRT